MPRRREVFVPGAYYHVFNRGVDRQRIFFERDNSLYFLQKVREYLLAPLETASDVRSDPDARSVRVTDSSLTATTPGVSVLAYCLMPNHYHLLVRLNCHDFSERMAALGKAYTQAINRRFQRVGPLFQSRFRAVEVETDEQLLHLSRYIHLNPVAANLTTAPAEWEFSSYPEYLGQRGGTLPDPKPILRLVGSADAYRRFVEYERVTPGSDHRHLWIDDEN